MNYQNLKLVIEALYQEAVFSWIIAVIGASLVSFKSNPITENNKPKPLQNLIAVLSGALFSRFTASPFAHHFTFWLDYLLLVYFIFGLIGNGIVNFIINLVKHLTSEKNAELISNSIRDFILKKLK